MLSDTTKAALRYQRSTYNDFLKTSNIHTKSVYFKNDVQPHFTADFQDFLTN